MLGSETDNKKAKEAGIDSLVRFTLPYFSFPLISLWAQSDYAVVLPRAEMQRKFLWQLAPPPLCCLANTLFNPPLPPRAHCFPPLQNVDDLKKMNKNKKIVRKLARKYDAFLSSQAVIKNIPRLLGPGLNRAGKFPSLVLPSDDVADKIEEQKATVKFQMKKVLCLSAAVAHVGMSKEQIVRNATQSINFMVSLLKKNWQNVAALYLKSTMGPALQIYF